jgi:hypothetical protein
MAETGTGKKERKNWKTRNWILLKILIPNGTRKCFVCDNDT